MGVMVKCRVCKHSFDRTIEKENEFWVQPTPRWYYHTECYQKHLKEKEAMDKIGYNAEIVTKTKLPFKITRAIKFKNQAQFHPRKYMLGLANVISKQNIIHIKHEGDYKYG